MSNFELLRAKWPALFREAVRAEREAFTDPRISCFYARRTLEPAVAWLYAADATLVRPFRALVGNGIQPKCDITYSLFGLEEGVPTHAWDLLARGEHDPPDEVSGEAVNKWLFNTDTVDQVLKVLMTRGHRVAGGDRLGRVVIFARNHLR